MRRVVGPKPGRGGELVKVFICYRRKSSQYLAKLLHDDLKARNSKIDVFLDTQSIKAGQDFPDRLKQQIENADVVIALIGRGWAKGLSNKDDWVRTELKLATTFEKTIIPVHHNGARLPAKSTLPKFLAKLPRRNAIDFSTTTNLDQDLETLHVRLMEQAPELAKLRQQVRRIYETEGVEQLTGKMEKAWSKYRDKPSPSLADCCRFTALTMARETGEAGTRDLWLVRALGTAHLAQAANPFAASLLPFFFRLCSINELSAAREVIDEIDRLADYDDPTQFPNGDEMRRIVQEKRAYSYLLEARLDDALKWYQQALETAERCSDDERGALKIRGSIALCHYLGGREEQSRREMTKISASAMAYPDVVKPATQNLAAMARGARTLGTGQGDLWAFEVT